MSVPETLYCPLCGYAMSRKGDRWYCGHGQMGIAQKVEEIIYTAMEQTPPAPPAEIEGAAERFSGHCPRCGGEFLTTERGIRVCPNCSLRLPGGVYYALTHTHSHLPNWHTEPRESLLSRIPVLGRVLFRRRRG